MIELFRHKDVSEPFELFIHSIESGTKSLDKANPEYYKRWKKERNNE